MLNCLIYYDYYREAHQMITLEANPCVTQDLIKFSCPLVGFRISYSKNSNLFKIEVFIFVLHPEETFTQSTWRFLTLGS